MDVGDAMGWSPVAVKRPFPKKGPRVKWAPQPQALLQAIPQPLTTNFG